MLMNEKMKIHSAKLYVSSILSPIQHIIQVTEEHFYIKEENTRLREELTEMKLKICDNFELLEENKRLKELLNYKSNYRNLFENYEFLTARVISYDPSPEFNSILIDKGAKDGLMKNMPVMNDRGLVGKIYAVNDFHSLILLVKDNIHYFSVLLQKSRIHSTIKWKNDNLFELLDISPLDIIEEEDIVITSGIGGVYPEGIPVGKVFSLEDTDSLNMRKTVIVSSYVDFNKLEDVIVLKKQDQHKYLYDEN